MTNTHMQRKIQGREEENVETDGLHQGLQNNSSQSEDLESLTMSEVSSRTADNLQNRISIQLHFIYLWIDRRVSLMHFNLAENFFLLYLRNLSEKEIILSDLDIGQWQGSEEETKEAIPLPRLAIPSNNRNGSYKRRQYGDFWLHWQVHLNYFNSEPLHLDLDLPQRYRPGTIRAVCEATGSV